MSDPTPVLVMEFPLLDDYGVGFYHIMRFSAGQTIAFSLE